MRKTLRFLAAFFAALQLGVLSMAVLAAAPQTYTVRLYAGNQAQFESSPASVEKGEGSSVSISGDMIEISGLPRSSVVSFQDLEKCMKFTDDSVGETGESKYYIRGVRKSGEDNDVVSKSAFVMNQDEILVVAYGVRGDMTQYTVNYVDQNGKEILPSSTLSGSVGDKIVVPYRYVSGFTPNAYNQTKTLSADASQNVFTFRYTRQAAPQPTPGPYINNGTTTNTGTTTGTGENVQDTGEEAVIESGTETGADETQNPPVETVEEPQEPVEIIDLDDVALSGGVTEEQNQGGRLWKWLLGGILFILFIIALIRFFFRRELE